MVRRPLKPEEEERAVKAGAQAWCCPDGCEYVKAGRQPECDAMTGEEWLAGRVRDMLRAALKEIRHDR